MQLNSKKTPPKELLVNKIANISHHFKTWLKAHKTKYAQLIGSNDGELLAIYTDGLDGIHDSELWAKSDLANVTHGPKIANSDQLQAVCVKMFTDSRLAALNADRKMQIHLKALGMAASNGNDYMPKYKRPVRSDEDLQLIANTIQSFAEREDLNEAALFGAVREALFDRLNTVVSDASTQLDNVFKMVQDKVDTCSDCFAHEFDKLKAYFGQKMIDTNERFRNFAVFLPADSSTLVGDGPSESKKQMCDRVSGTIQQQYNDLFDNIEAGIDEMGKITEFSYLFVHNGLSLILLRTN